jgi:hypothetical protein
MPVIMVYQDFESFSKSKHEGDFVIKPSHASGAAILVGKKFKTEINQGAKTKHFRFITIAADDYPMYEDLVLEVVRNWFDSDYSSGDTKFPEITYSRLTPKVLVEPLLNFGDLMVPDDFKFHVYRGAVRFIQVDSNRLSGHERSFFTPTWEKIDATVIFPRLKSQIEAPSCLEEMIAIAEKLSFGLELARIDFLMNGTDLFVSEISLFPDGGFGRFNSPELRERCET